MTAPAGYPRVRDEDTTLAALSQSSIARFGDGELRCAVGSGCTSQRANAQLAVELQVILGARTNCLIGIPNPFSGCPREESWLRYAQSNYTRYMRPEHVYDSAFITRPDNAPWIDRPDYWATVRGLWYDKDIVLVAGDKKSLTSEMIGGDAASVREVIGPRQHAYADIDRLEEEIGTPGGTVLLCLGTTATVLAHRLALKGVHALDLGHIGMFMRHVGAYRYGSDDVASTAYRQQLALMHRGRRWGADGAKHTGAVLALVEMYHPATILDYGCGENKLAESMLPIRVSGYDPGIHERAKMPKPCDLVVCTDVLEHVEPEKLDAVFDHIHRLTGRVAYFVISTRPANAVLPDGRNAHLSVHPTDWWVTKFIEMGWLLTGPPVLNAKELTLVAEKRKL